MCACVSVFVSECCNVPKKMYEVTYHSDYNLWLLGTSCKSHE